MQQLHTLALEFSSFGNHHQVNLHQAHGALALLAGLGCNQYTAMPAASAASSSASCDDGLVHDYSEYSSQWEATSIRRDAKQGGGITGIKRKGMLGGCATQTVMEICADNNNTEYPHRIHTRWIVGSTTMQAHCSLHPPGGCCSNTNTPFYSNDDSIPTAATLFGHQRPRWPAAWPLPCPPGLLQHPHAIPKLGCCATSCHAGTGRCDRHGSGPYM